MGSNTQPVGIENDVGSGSGEKHAQNNPCNVIAASQFGLLSTETFVTNRKTFG